MIRIPIKLKLIIINLISVTEEDLTYKYSGLIQRLTLNPVTVITSEASGAFSRYINTQVKALGTFPVTTEKSTY